MKIVFRLKRHLLTLPTCVPTCVRASIRAFNCSSISGSFDNWASFCSESSNFSWMAAIFSSWSWWRKKHFSFSIYNYNGPNRNQPSTEPLCVSILAPISHSNHATTSIPFEHASNVSPMWRYVLLGLPFERHFHANLVAIWRNVPVLYRILSDVLTNCLPAHWFCYSNQTPDVAIGIVQRSKGKCFLL